MRTNDDQKDYLTTWDQCPPRSFYILVMTSLSISQCKMGTNSHKTCCKERHVTHQLSILFQAVYTHSMKSISMKSGITFVPRVRKYIALQWNKPPWLVFPPCSTPLSRIVNATPVIILMKFDGATINHWVHFANSSRFHHLNLVKKVMRSHE